ncbi:epsin-3 [Spinacia oleracea]|uniref:Epsin-3 n=1 Tax=Spinacia oleracea TaxID=3562 RepID=A0A9R0I2X3_SPIOL|nr:epsin-3 [Spinacia oleracea]XP_056686775.1 epsin-3 [Spinacia oleracea]
MSILGFDSNNCSNMSRHSFLELKKQASFFIKEKIKTARLVLTDVTPAQLMAEEATNANPWSPDTRILGLISRAAFDVDDYWRIVDILHNKLSNFDRKNWRESYNALIVLEHLLTHGPESVAEEFQTEKFIINNMETFQHVDEKGFNWGLAVRKKSERVLKLLQKGALLKQEREHARKLTREIKGFGSFSVTSTSPLEDSLTTYGRSHSQFNEHGNETNPPEKFTYNQPRLFFLDDDVKADKPRTVKRFLKENKAPKNDTGNGDLDVWNNNTGEKNLLLDETNGGVLIEEENHPFNGTVEQSRVSLLSAAKED